MIIIISSSYFYHHSYLQIPVWEGCSWNENGYTFEVVLTSFYKIRNSSVGLSEECGSEILGRLKLSPYPRLCLWSLKIKPPPSFTSSLAEVFTAWRWEEQHNSSSLIDISSKCLGLEGECVCVYKDSVKKRNWSETDQEKGYTDQKQRFRGAVLGTCYSRLVLGNLNMQIFLISSQTYWLNYN